VTLLYPLLMFKWPWHLGVLDMGPVVSGYLGLVLFSAAAVAIGLMISSITESQVIAFFVTFIVLLAFYMIGDLAEVIPNLAGTVLRELSFKEHFNSFGRGLIDTTDIVFFLSCAALALILSFRSLESRKWA
jgi:ABC-2 type transport system permease protein